MVPPNTRGRGNHFAHLEDVYNQEETIREEQAVAYQQHSEVQFTSLRDQIEALSKQLANVGGRKVRRQIPSLHILEEEDKQNDGDGSKVRSARASTSYTSTCQLVGVPFQTLYSKIPRGSSTRRILGLGSDS
jgi:hypothetical protein